MGFRIMKRNLLNLLFVLSVFLLCNTTAWGHPASQIELKYDIEEQNLNIQLKHVSKNPRKHFIRRIFIYKNDEEVEVLRFVTQNSGKGLSVDVALDAQANDTIRIKTICNVAGRKEKTLVVSSE